jgi:FKBP-type peptidyl-prolyl cis-trans isomerase
MENKNSMNMVVAVVICLALVGFLIFISINNKVNMATDNNINNTGNISGNIPDDMTPTLDNTTSTAVAKTGDAVTVNYTGRLENGTVFDSNVDPKFSYKDPASGKELHYLVPFEFQLGTPNIITGWNKGIVGMKAGDKKTLTIAPEDAYGAAGRPPVIPPNATLIFDIELLSINN